MPLRRSPENPILLPNKENAWESEATFNASVTKQGGTFHFVYRASSAPREVHGATIDLSTIGYARSGDGVHLRDRRQLIFPEYDWERYGCEDPRVTKLGGKYYIFYTALSTYPFGADGIKVALATTKDFKTITSKHPVTPFNAKAMALFPGKINGKYVAVLTANTDRPPARIAAALFEKESDIWSKEYWDKWYANLDLHTLPLQRTGNDQIEIGAPPIKTKYGWLLIYSYIRNYFASSGRVFGIEAALLDLKDPMKILAHTYRPILVPDEEYEEYGRVPNIVFPSGALLDGNTLRIYYGAADTTTCFASGKFTEFMNESLAHQLSAARLSRFEGNPILHPHPTHQWESQAVFNPGALYEDGKVHLIYRAMSGDSTSTFGYAASVDGVHITERLPEPIYVPREDFEKKLQSGNSGCEDPRLTRIGETVYVCYTAFDGKNPPRVALTSISLHDFLAHRWNWAKPVLISPPGIDDKDACVFPKKINDEFVFVHRIGSSIWLDFVPNPADLGVTRWLGGQIVMKPRGDSWDSRKIGLAAPPIETPKGWLLLYHGVSESSQKYRAGVALLDLKDPMKVLGRTEHPILEPDMPYEHHGIVPKVVFPCGAVCINEQLFVYYGGADKVIGVATAPIATLLKELTTKRKEKMSS